MLVKYISLFNIHSSILNFSWLNDTLVTIVLSNILWAEVNVWVLHAHTRARMHFQEQLNNNGIICVAEPLNPDIPQPPQVKQNTWWWRGSKNTERE